MSVIKWIKHDVTFSGLQMMICEWLRTTFSVSQNSSNLSQWKLPSLDNESILPVLIFFPFSISFLAEGNNGFRLIQARPKERTLLISTRYDNYFLCQSLANEHFFSNSLFIVNKITTNIGKEKVYVTAAEHLTWFSKNPFWTQFQCNSVAPFLIVIKEQIIILLK